jgi:hypothetical protein
MQSTIKSMLHRYTECGIMVFSEDDRWTPSANPCEFAAAAQAQIHLRELYYSKPFIHKWSTVSRLASVPSSLYHWMTRSGTGAYRWSSVDEKRAFRSGCSSCSAGVEAVAKAKPAVVMPAVMNPLTGTGGIWKNEVQRWQGPDRYRQADLLFCQRTGLEVARAVPVSVGIANSMLRKRVLRRLRQRRIVATFRSALPATLEDRCCPDGSDQDVLISWDFHI